ncbi:MAG: magnesium transporter [Pseudomonadota bacterium]
MSLEATDQGAADAPALDADYALNPAFVQSVLAALDEGRNKRVRKLISTLHVADQADLIGLIRADERRRLIQALGEVFDPECLSELEEDVRDEVLEILNTRQLAAAVTELPSDDAIYLLEDLDEDKQRIILDQIPDQDRAALEVGLRYGDETAGRLMQREVITVPSYWTIGQTIDYLRSNQTIPTQFFEIFVTDPLFHAVGTLPLSRILTSTRKEVISEVMDPAPRLISAELDKEEVAYLFNQYHLISAPVVDADDRIVGVITVDDVVDVIREETGEDMLALAGVGLEGLSDSVFKTTRRRFSWLFVNLLTAIAASIVIAFFDGTIQEKVALAVLMPIVASMGGNAGTQTLTVAVRALATRDLTATNAARIVFREVLVGGLNGLLFAALLGSAAALYYEPVIGLVLALAMIVNLLAAGLAGILVPITLDRMGADPALASTVLVTTVTDIVGFFVFLGLATIVL